VVRHEAGDHPDDRKHVSAAVTVPVVELAGRVRGTRVGGARPGRDGSDVRGPGEEEALTYDVPRATELVVCVQRRDGAPDTWLYAGDGADQRLELDVAGWARLLPAVAGVLAVVTGRSVPR